MTYQKFKEHFNRASNTKRSAKGLTSNDPNQRGIGRANLEGIINTTLGAETVIPETSDGGVLAYVPQLINYHESVALGPLGFADNPGGIIQEAHTEFPEKFTENYLRVTPIEITGDNAHNQITARHRVYKGLSGAIEGVSKSDDERDLAGFSNATAQLLEQDVRQRLGVPGADANAVQALVQLAGASYRTSSPHRALRRASAVAGRIKQEIEQMLPETERADYTIRTLNQHLANGHEGIQQAGRDLYSIIE